MSRTGPWSPRLGGGGLVPRWRQRGVATQLAPMCRRRDHAECCSSRAPLARSDPECATGAPGLAILAAFDLYPMEQRSLPSLVYCVCVRPTPLAGGFPNRRAAAAPAETRCARRSSSPSNSEHVQLVVISLGVYRARNVFATLSPRKVSAFAASS